MQKIYLDNAGTTKPNSEFVENSLNFLQENFYNPSALYSGGVNVKKQIELARQGILKAFSPNYDLIFTSCGSEADNVALFSFARRGNIVVTSGEHSAVFQTCSELKQRGVEVRFANLNKNASVNVEHLLSLVDQNTQMVCVMHVNNETGAINDINGIAKLVKQKNNNTIFFSDGVQAFLKLDYKISNDVDLYSVSAHKICALKGTGALVYNKKLHLKPLIFGGGQEKNLRSGTENVFGIMTFFNAFEYYYPLVSQNALKIEKIKNEFCNSLKDYVTFISDQTCSPYIVSLSVNGIKAEIVQRLLDDSGIIVGTGSACSSKLGVSRVISQLKYDKKIAEGTLRFSFIYDTDLNEVLHASDCLKQIIERLRKTLK